MKLNSELVQYQRIKLKKKIIKKEKLNRHTRQQARGLSKI
jgi:hypothetical protein